MLTENNTPYRSLPRERREGKPKRHFHHEDTGIMGDETHALASHPLVSWGTYRLHSWRLYSRLATRGVLLDTYDAFAVRQQRWII